MICKDSRGNEFVEMINAKEKEVMEKFSPVTHCLAVVVVDGEYLLGWNNYRKVWETFGGCREEGESPRQCIICECYEELGLSDVKIDYVGLMHLNLVPDYFSTECREEYGCLYGITLKPEELKKIEQLRLDREEIGKISLLKNISEEEKICEIDRALLDYYRG
ncbi:MAG: NUDIX hydrolase [Roseburia sp.]|nr:NUDIX hydrolase [Roseburia sp.]